MGSVASLLPFSLFALLSIISNSMGLDIVGSPLKWNLALSILMARIAYFLGGSFNFSHGPFFHERSSKIYKRGQWALSPIHGSRNFGPFGSMIWNYRFFYPSCPICVAKRFGSINNLLHYITPSNNFFLD